MLKLIIKVIKIYILRVEKSKRCCKNLYSQPKNIYTQLKYI